MVQNNRYRRMLDILYIEKNENSRLLNFRKENDIILGNIIFLTRLHSNTNMV